MAKKTNSNINGHEYYRLRRKIGVKANGKPVMKNFYGKGKKEAEEQYFDFMSKVSLSHDGTSSLGTVAKFYTYEVFINSNFAPGTIELYERQYRTFLLPSKLATQPIRDIRSADIQKFFNSLAEGKFDGKEVQVSNGSIIALSNYMKHLFRYLSLEGYCDNIMATVTIPKKEMTEEPTEIIVFSDDEIQKILSTESEYSMLYTLALSTGLRQGELLGLKHTDIKGSTIRVVRQLAQNRKIYSDGTRQGLKIIKYPKSAKSNRTVPIPQNVLPTLQEWVKGHTGSEYLFFTKSGRMIDKSNLRRAWTRHLKKAGVEYKKFHALRATYCTILCQNKTPIEIASALMGHDNIETTAKYYRSVGYDDKAAAADSINHIFSIKK